MKISILCMVLSAAVVLSLIIYTEATDGPVGMADFTPDASLEITNDGHGDTFLMGEPDYEDDSTPFVVEDSIDANTEPIMIRTREGVWLNTLGGGIARGIVDLWD